MLRELLEDRGLVQQAKVNTPREFAESPAFDYAVTRIVAENHGDHNKMSNYFFSNAPDTSASSPI